MKILKISLISLIKVYQYIFSPILGPHCRFEPTCSSYSIEALQKYGVLKGISLSVLRILRCNPWSNSGYDPVPNEHSSHSNKLRD